MKEPDIIRCFLSVAYNGTSYHGWQIQHNAHTVQGTIEKALTTLLRKEVKIFGSSRTDTGVHATQQFAHLDLPTIINREKLIYQLNAFLPPTISVDAILPVDTMAHARFDAISRTYEYRMTQKKDPFLQKTSYYFSQKLDINAMNQASAQLIGKHNFKSFSKKKSSLEHHLCHLMEAKWQHNENEILFHVKANRFLRGMVRALVGTLLEVGLHRLSFVEFQDVIVKEDRSAAASSAPACGLFLTEVMYPKDFFIPRL